MALTKASYSLITGAPVNVLDYGADSTGEADSTTAINAALTAGAGGAVFIPAGTYKTTAALTVSANTLVYGAGKGASKISCTNANVSQIVLTGNLISLQDLTISVTVAGTTSNIGGVIVNGNNNSILNVEIIGVSWAGIFLTAASSYNLVDNCYFHGFQGSVQDSADVCFSYLTGSTSYNTVRNNVMYGGNWHGVLILGTTSANPQYNLITGNRIGQHSTYGIVDYRQADLDSFNQITNNYIENIQGSTLAGNSGAGIYCVATGGVLIEGNTINNCCVQTTTVSLAPAGIGINGVGSGVAPINIIGNVIENMTKYEGIYVVSSSNGCNVIGNRIRMPANTTGSGGVYINASSNVLVNGNNINITPTTGNTVDGIFVNPLSAINNIVISDNTITGGNAYAIRFYSGTSSSSGVSINGNAAYGGGTTAGGLQLASIIGGVVTGNNCSQTTANSINVTNCTYLRIANNYLTTTGSSAVATLGTCTGSYFDKTNYWSGTMSNGATGLIVEQLNNAAPAAGTWAVGDRIEQSVPVAGQPKGWRCTVAGTPGTWVSEGNL